MRLEDCNKNVYNDGNIFAEDFCNTSSELIHLSSTSSIIIISTTTSSAAITRIILDRVTPTRRVISPTSRVAPLISIHTWCCAWYIKKGR